MHNSQIIYTTLYTHSMIAKYKVKPSIHRILFLHSRLPDRPAVGSAGEGPTALRNVPEIVLPIVLYLQVRIIMKQSVRLRYLACMYFKLIHNHILYAICHTTPIPYLICLDLRAVQQVVHPFRARRKRGRQVALHYGLSAETKSTSIYICIDKHTTLSPHNYTYTHTSIYTHTYTHTYKCDLTCT